MIGKTHNWYYPIKQLYQLKFLVEFGNFEER